MIQDCAKGLRLHLCIHGLQAMAELLTEDEVRRWQTLEEQRTFERSGRAAYCPRCSAMCLEADDGSNCAQCPRQAPQNSAIKQLGASRQPCNCHSTATSSFVVAKAYSKPVQKQCRPLPCGLRPDQGCSVSGCRCFSPFCPIAALQAAHDTS